LFLLFFLIPQAVAGVA